MRIYLKNNPAKFHSDPIWNEGALGFLKMSPRQEKEQQEQQDEQRYETSSWFKEYD